MIHIAAVHMSPGGTKHEHIASVIWINDSFVSGACSVAVFIEFLEKNPGQAQVSSNDSTSTVEVVNANPKYIRSVKDGSVSDNLLKVTRY